MSVATDTVLALIDDCASDLSLLPILADALEDCGEEYMAETCRCPTGRTINPKVAPGLLSAWAFFARNCGYATPPGRLTCAWKLAMAERYAAEEGWECRWEEDQGGCSGCDCDSEDCPCAMGEGHETLGCCLLSFGYEDVDAPGTILASLWGICGATADYRRVVEAELALEAMEREKD